MRKAIIVLLMLFLVLIMAVPVLAQDAPGDVPDGGGDMIVYVIAFIAMIGAVSLGENRLIELIKQLAVLAGVKSFDWVPLANNLLGLTITFLVTFTDALPGGTAIFDELFASYGATLGEGFDIVLRLFEFGAMFGGLTFGPELIHKGLDKVGSNLVVKIAKAKA